jgi:hypothetical protein
MSLNTAATLDAIASHAMATGRFDRVNTHEPKNAPGNGLSVAIWVDSITPTQSGLAATTARVVYNVRVYTSMLSEPQDAIDPNLIEAADVLLEAYSGDFSLGGNVRNVDLLGASGPPLSAQAGYLSQDNKVYRVMTITLPLILNDAWTQVT